MDPTTKKQSLVFVDDHRGAAQAVSYAVATQAGLNFLGLFPDTPSALAALPGLSPDLVVFDWRMPGGEGIIIPRQLRSQMPHTQWLLYTAYTNAYVVNSAGKAGVNGVVSKGAEIDVLVQGCREVLAGRTFLCPECTKVQRDALSGADRTADLTEREQEILRHIASGREAQATAIAMSIEVKTVHNQLHSIRKKLSGWPNVETMVGLRNFAVIHGLGPSDEGGPKT